MRQPLAILLCFVCPLFLRADLAEMDARFARLPPGAPVLDARGIAGFALWGSGGKASVVAVEGQSFSEAQQIRTEVQPTTAYALQLAGKTAAAVKKGDALLGIVFARALELPAGSDEAHTELVFELGTAPNTKSVTCPLSVSPRWEKYYVPFTAAGDYAAGEANVAFRLGYAPQLIEIGGFQLLNYGSALTRRDLPYTPLTYLGRAPDAPWRAQAEGRIEKLRKGDLTVSVRDASGQPVRDAVVAVKMTRHAFGFGAAVDAAFLFDEGSDADRYRETIQRDFNRVVLENHLKWPLWEQDRETGVRAVAWLRERGIEVRGHTLVWPGKKNLPESVLPLFERPGELRAAILAHIADILGALRGQCVEWDVVNEDFTNHDVQKVLGDDCLAEWFRAARAAEPTAKLDINDYSILESGGRDFAHQDHYFQIIQRLVDAGAPIQGIGLQSHFNEDLTPISRLGEILDRFASFGLPLQVTEFDIDTHDEQLQADYTRDFLTAIFSHPATIGFLTWGFWEKRHWIPHGAHLRADWTERPAGKAWRDLVFRDWWTHATAKTGVLGDVKVRGFLGDYTIAVRAGTSTASATARLSRDGTRVEVTLPPTPPGG